jgi:hypothetical protein
MLRRLTQKSGNTRPTRLHQRLAFALTVGLGLAASTLSACSDDDFGRDGSTTTTDLSATVTDLAKSTDLAVVVDMRVSD